MCTNCKHIYPKENMENPHPRRLPQAIIPHSHRQRSGSTTTNSSSSASKSATQSGRTGSRRQENDQDSTSVKSNKRTQKKTEEITDASAGFVMFLPRSKSKTELPRRTRSASTSPSAWALSPGRSSPLPALVQKSPSLEKLKRELKGGGGGGGGVSAVLKFFRQKKVCPVLEEEYHRFRVMHNRLLHWRFVNARAEASMAAVKRVAQKKLFDVWVRISTAKNFIVEKRNQVVKLKRKVKLCEIMKSQMKYLTEWSRIEAKNCEAIGRVVRKLSAISVCLPLVDGAEAKITSFNDAISTAMGVVDSIEAMIVDLHKQIDTTSYVLVELMIVLEQHKQYFEELEKRIAIVTSLEIQENSLRVGSIQRGKEMTGT